MLYLAEVQKQKSGFMGAGKAELKLLAYQRADQTWNPVTAEEVVTAEEANNLNAGVLVLADLNPNRQVQRIQEAGRPLVSILQNFSRQLEKSKNQEAEIDQWKQSLTYQSQELSRRNMEMEARLEELQQMEIEFKQLEAQKQEIDSGQEKVQQLQAEIERNRHELEGAWEHLRGEQRRLQEQQTTVLDAATANQIQELLSRLSSGIPVDELQTQLNFSVEMVANQQSLLDQNWQQLEQQRRIAQQQQEEVDRQTEALQNSDREWQAAQSCLEQLKLDLQVQAAVLNTKQEYAQILGLQLQNQEVLAEQISSFSENFNKVDIIQKVDLAALETMPLEQLKQVVQDLQKDLQNASRFVNDQEEELSYLQQTIEELQGQVNKANDSDRSNLQTQLAEEQNSYQFLNQTLVGQRQNLRERQEILNQHYRILWRRQGNGELTLDTKNIDLAPIVVQIQTHRQQQVEALQKLEQEISQLRDRIGQTQATLDAQTTQQDMQRQELQSLRDNLLSLRVATAECWGRVNLYQEFLQPVQDSLDGLRQKLEAIAPVLNQIQESSSYQLTAIAQMGSSLSSIMPTYSG